MLYERMEEEERGRGQERLQGVGLFQMNHLKLGEVIKKKPVENGREQ